MALTEFQRTICHLIAGQRIASGESYVAGGVALNTVTGSPKERNMRRDPRVTLTIVDPADIYRYAELRGHVEFEEGQAAVNTIDALAKKYIGQDTYPWNQPGHVRINCRLIVERELGAP